MEKSNCAHAKIIVHPASIEVLVNATWDFAKRILWSKFHFGEDEILLSLSYIREHYEEIPPENFQKQSFSWFETYCKHIIIAKVNYRQEFAHPCIWFNKLNPDGFSKFVNKQPNNYESFKPIKQNLHGDRSY